MTETILTLLLITAFGSFMFELSGITQDLWAFFMIKPKEWWYIPVKLTTCGKCASFHAGWIYFSSTGHDWLTSFALASACGILSIYICNNAYSGTIH